MFAYKEKCLRIKANPINVPVKLTSKDILLRNNKQFGPFINNVFSFWLTKWNNKIFSLPTETTNTNAKTQIRPITKLPTTCTTNTHPKKSRTVFTKKQINELEGVFYQKRYLTIKDREELSRRLTLTENQVDEYSD